MSCWKQLPRVSTLHLLANTNNTDTQGSVYRAVVMIELTRIMTKKHIRCVLERQGNKQRTGQQSIANSLSKRRMCWFGRLISTNHIKHYTGRFWISRGDHASQTWRGIVKKDLTNNNHNNNNRTHHANNILVPTPVHRSSSSWHRMKICCSQLENNCNNLSLHGWSLCQPCWVIFSSALDWSTVFHCTVRLLPWFVE